ncbi:MAG: hypothetical protein J3R72DRAFT_441662 [Linnemannia gamsii]|nr:MAG: hypothetical protein J3R72DRAFT_441662 [Linnemannia gamsii]
MRARRSGQLLGATLLGALLLCCCCVQAAPVLPIDHPSASAGASTTVTGYQTNYVWKSRGTYETFDRACVLTKERPIPVVLLPGMLSPGLVTTRYMAHRLQDAGYCVYQLEYGLGLMDTLVGVQDMRASAHDLALFVDKVLNITGAQQVDLVGHAEGSLVSLWYLRKLGGEKHIRRFSGIAPLFRGTTFRGLITILKGLNFYDTLAILIEQFCPACTQVVERSPFLQELHTTVFDPNAPPMPSVSTVNYLMVMTNGDEVVTPFFSGYLDDVGDETKVKHVIVEDICESAVGGGGSSGIGAVLSLLPLRHVGLMFSPLVFALVDGFLTPESERPVLDCQTT